MSSAARNLEQLLDPLYLQQQTRAPSQTRQSRAEQQAASERTQRRRRLPGCRPQQESFTCRGRGSAAYLLSVSLGNPGGHLAIQSSVRDHLRHIQISGTKWVGVRVSKSVRGVAHLIQQTSTMFVRAQRGAREGLTACFMK